MTAWFGVMGSGDRWSSSRTAGPHFWDQARSRSSGNKPFNGAFADRCSLGLVDFSAVLLH
jgi:hypothetical protein